MDYWEWKIVLKPVKPWSEIIVAHLADLGFESFVDQDNGVDAYIQNDLLNTEEVQKTLGKIQDQGPVVLSYSTKFLPHQNWNETWEADFEPVFIDDYGTILAPFHDKKLAKGMLLLVQPQMSFGTGHHQTTYLMCKALFELEQIPDKVLDMGAGTGILAILAEKLGAKSCVAVDIEEWSAVNASENAERNECSKIESLHGDIDILEGRKFGMILANINRNVLIRHLPSYYELLEQKGVLFLSGFFDTDCSDLIEIAENVGFQFVNKTFKENWACLQLKK
ncbi:MAG: 50S ribosomal protein L11 methyltransferase [Bacteroidetes bacterium]|nr:50S ribosomal protein L11 methyltransferase [Bacteroidota bacterium]